MSRRKPSFCSHIRLARTTERVLQMDVCSQASRTIADVCWKQRRSDCLRQPNCLKQSLIASGSSTSPFCALLAASPDANFPTSCTARTTWRAQILRDSSAIWTIPRAPAGTMGWRRRGRIEIKCRASGWDGAVQTDFREEFSSLLQASAATRPSMQLVTSFSFCE